jgi:hypothetical protein
MAHKWYIKKTSRMIRARLYTAIGPKAYKRYGDAIMQEVVMPVLEDLLKTSDRRAKRARTFQKQLERYQNMPDRLRAITETQDKYLRFRKQRITELEQALDEIAFYVTEKRRYPNTYDRIAEILDRVVNKEANDETRGTRQGEATV